MTKDKKQTNPVNHLGNVLTTVSDRRKLNCNNTTFEADVINTYDYSPFGAPLPGRSLGNMKCSQYSISNQLIPLNEFFSTPGSPLGCSSATEFYVLTNNTRAQNIPGVLRVRKGSNPPGNCGSVNLTDVTGMLFPQAVGKIFSVSDGRTYSVKFRFRKTGPGSFFFRIVNNTTNVVLSTTPFSPTISFMQFTFNNHFSVSANATYRIEFFRVGNNSNTDSYLIDEVKIESDVFFVPVSVCVPTGTDYRFGSGGGGQEKDNEIYGVGNSYTAEYWQYDTRLGRRWNVDPVFFPDESPYSAFKNNPIFYNDPKGDWPPKWLRSIIEYVSPVAISVSVKISSHGVAVSASASIGVPKIAPISYRKNLGVIYNATNTNPQIPKVQTTSGYTVTVGGVIGYTEETKNVKKADGTETNQTTGTVTLGGPIVNVDITNDLWGDGGDRFATASAQANIGPLNVGFKLNTEDLPIEGKDRTKDQNGNYVTTPVPEEREGIIYIGIGNIKLGTDSDKNRELIQGTAHKILNYPQFKNIDKPKKNYIEIEF